MTWKWTCWHAGSLGARCDIDLTGREYELLEYLLRHKNEIVTRDMIAWTSGRRRPGR